MIEAEIEAIMIEAEIANWDRNIDDGYIHGWMIDERDKQRGDKV